MSTDTEVVKEQIKEVETEVSLIKRKYRVESVEKSEPPEGMPAGNWHRYIVGQGGSKIEGFKPGTLKAVTQHAENVAEILNARAANGGKSTYATHKRK